MIQWKRETEKFNRIFTSDLMLNLIRCIVWFIIIYTRYWRGDECCRYWVLAISIYLEWPKHEIRECGVDSIYLCFLQIIAIHNYYKQKPKLKLLTPNEANSILGVLKILILLLNTKVVNSIQMLVILPARYEVNAPIVWTHIVNVTRLQKSILRYVYWVWCGWKNELHCDLFPVVHTPCAAVYT